MPAAPTPHRSNPPSARRRVRIGATALAAATCAGLFATPAVAASGEPPTNGHGVHFVDAYRTNVNTNLTPESNAAIALLEPFSEIWTAGESWNDGTLIDEAVHASNLAQSIEITRERTEEDAARAYLVDRRNQSYTAIDGFGPYADAVREAANAGTTIPDAIPSDATTVKYDDKGNANGVWADTDSELGTVVQLVNTLRGGYSSGNNAKAYFAYQRPWRWSSDVVVVPELEPAKSPTPETDGGFPSGHTNAVYLADLAFAYAYPERFQELLANASEVGNGRIVAGMHSPLDVMGGRILATALAAAILNDPANAELAAQAHAQAEEVLADATPTGEDRFGDDAETRAAYRSRLTYGFEQTGDPTIPATVPKGAEALLRTRLPYLTDAQIREVLRTTALPSGYPLLDDAEGWGRLDLVSAAAGYGAFDEDVNVVLDAAQGGFNAGDAWRNDITGTGSLTKQGSGTLTLTGENEYSGGTQVVGGPLAAASESALGVGDVSVADGGTLTETADGTLTIGGGLTLAPGAELSLTLEDAGTPLAVAGTATIGGSLTVDVGEEVVPDDVVLVSAGELAEGAGFSSFEINGLPEGYDATLEYRDGAVHLVNAAAEVDGGDDPSTGSIALGASTVTAGGTLTVTGSGLAADAPFGLWLRSTPVLLAEPRSSGTGTLEATVTIPADAEPGAHTVALVGADGTTVASAAITVLAATDSAAHADPAGEEPAGDLAETGFGAAPGLLWGAALLVAGAGALAGMRIARRRTQAD